MIKSGAKQELGTSARPLALKFDLLQSLLEAANVDKHASAIRGQARQDRIELASRIDCQITNVGNAVGLSMCGKSPGLI